MDGEVSYDDRYNMEALHGSTVDPSASMTSAGGCQPSTIPLPKMDKTDKPRPHVCTICSRSFARLEHLKRHERSHTKEKPFECPECTRCFARRDLLLRHQQKLHAATTPSSRPRTSRRESNLGSGRIRKTSGATGTPHVARPRANTLGHIDKNTLKVLGASSHLQRNLNVDHASPNGDPTLPATRNHQDRVLAHASSASMHSLPRLKTSALPLEHAGGLRTAPVFGGFQDQMAMDPSALGPSTTINPSQLHMGRLQDLSVGDMSLHHPSNLQIQTEGFGFEWTNQGFENHDFFGQNNESAIDTSSPSLTDGNSPTGLSDGMLDVNSASMGNFPGPAPQIWDGSMGPQTQMMPTHPNFDFRAADLDDMISPFQAPPLTNFDSTLLMFVQQANAVSTLQG